jgi:HEAT repeats/Putative zinc-finger
MNCESAVKQLPLMLYGELSFDEEERIHEHVDKCAECKAELKRVQQMQRAFDAVEPEMPATLLQDSRRSLRISLQEATGASRRIPLTARLAEWFSAPSRWKPAAALTLLAIGFFGGRLVPPTPAVSPARSNEPVATRVRYIQPNEDGDVQLVVEEVRQRVLSGGMDDNRIRTLLLSAARESSDPGVRVETMDLLKSQSGSEEVRHALLAALQNDPNAGVRLKALDALRAVAEENETRRVLSEVLLTDENPGVRTQAIDLLTQKREPALVGVLQELMTRENNNYVRLKCQKVLQEMNASAEIF